MADPSVYAGYQPSITGADFPLGPSRWPAGQQFPLRASRRVYASDLNSQLSAPVSFLSRKPMFRGTQQTLQAIPANTWTAVTLDTETADPWQMHSTQADTSRIVIPYSCDGLWLVQGSAPMAATAAGNMYGAGLIKNGAVYSTGEYLNAPSIHVSPSMADLVTCVGGDYLSLAAYTTYSGGVNTYINNAPAGGVQFADDVSPVLTARWVSAYGYYNNNIIAPPGITTSPPGIGIPAPGTWTALQEATAAQFNSDIANAVAFLAAPPFFRAAVSSPAAIPTAAVTHVTGFAGSGYLDNWGQWSSSTGTWTCQEPGLYLCGGNVGWASQASAFSTYAQLRTVLSGTTTLYSGSDANGAYIASMAMRTIRFAAGDTLQLWAFQNFGSSLTPSSNTRLFTLWISS